MNTLKELYLEAARVAELIEGTELTMGECWKYDGGVFNKHDVVSFRAELSRYEACLAIVKGKPVFKGDNLYHKSGHKYTVQEIEKHKDGRFAFRTVHGPFIDGDWIGDYSWNPPKRTVMVEMLVEDAEFMVSAYCTITKHTSKTSQVAEACRKALEGVEIMTSNEQRNLTSSEQRTLAIECGAYFHGSGYAFSYDELAAYTAAVEANMRERCINEAQRVKDIIAAKYQERIDTGTSDMTSNSDWMRLEGAVSVVEAIRSLK